MTGRPQPRRRQVLEILQQNTGWWLTPSDLAIWVYGDDDWDSQQAIKNLIYKLRLDGYVIEARVATWTPLSNGKVLAHRLVGHPNDDAKTGLATGPIPAVRPHTSKREAAA